MLNYFLLRHNNGLDLLFGGLILFIIYLIFSNISIIIKSIFKLISKIFIGVIGVLAILISYILIGIDFLLILFFCGGFWFVVGIQITDNRQLIFLFGVIWFTILLFLRYYFKIKFLRFKFFQFISENVFGLRREDLLNQD